MIGLDNPLHLAMLLVIVLLVFGAKRLPEMGRSLGAGMRGFKETISGESSHESHESHDAHAELMTAHEQSVPTMAPLPAASGVAARPGAREAA